MRALWSDRQNCSHNVSQTVKGIRRFSENKQSLSFVNKLTFLRSGLQQPCILETVPSSPAKGANGRHLSDGWAQRPRAVESSIAVEDGWESRPLSRLGYRHYSTMVRLSLLSGLRWDGRVILPACGWEIGRDRASQSHSLIEEGGPIAVEDSIAFRPLRGPLSGWAQIGRTPHPRLNNPLVYAWNKCRAIVKLSFSPGKGPSIFWGPTRAIFKHLAL